MRIRKDTPSLYLIIPCYNEETVLPQTSILFEGMISRLIYCGKISRHHQNV